MIKRAVARAVRPAACLALFGVGWQIAVRFQPAPILPGPLAVGRGLGELVRHGLLLKYIVASLFRVTWGFLLAVVVSVPAGLALGWYRRAGLAVNPIVQILRPISPLAWT